MKKSFPRPMSLSRVKITDELYGSYVNLVAEKIIPYQWDILNDRVPGAEKSHCVENFRIAAGESQGDHYGPVFCDTDAYKWLEAVAYCIENGSDGRYEPTADDLIDLIGRAQRPNGYLNTYYTVVSPGQRWLNLTEGHELYSAGHLMEAAVAYYKATGKDKLLQIACKFADLICEVFGSGQKQCQGYPGHQEIELALVKLYHATGRARYLELADFFIKERGVRPNYLIEEIQRRQGNGLFKEFADYDEEYAQSHQPPVEQKTAEGHAVRALYMYAAMADLAIEQDDQQLNEACLKLWNNITTKRMHITGGVGTSGHLERFTVDYDLPNNSTYCESCASIGLMMFGQRMAALTGDASFYDIVEKSLCNTVLAGIAVTGDKYFYVNPLEVWPENCKPSTSMSHVKPVRQPWFPVACCPPNIARTLASLAQYIYSQDDLNLYINQFISSEMETSLEGAKIKLKLESSFMQDGLVTIQVQASAACSLKIRMPGYCDYPDFTLDGSGIIPPIENNYAVFILNGNGEYEISMKYEVKPHFVAANHRVRADAGKAALVKGPYVYCLEEVDNGSELSNILIDTTANIQEDKPLAGMPGRLPVIKYSGKKIISSIVDDRQLYGKPVWKLDDVNLTAVPYCLWCNREAGEMLVWQKVERLI